MCCIFVLLLIYKIMLIVNISNNSKHSKIGW